MAKDDTDQSAFVAPPPERTTDVLDHREMERPQRSRGGRPTTEEGAEIRPQSGRGILERRKETADAPERAVAT
jgi:hypothetical protein